MDAIDGRDHLSHLNCHYVPLDESKDGAYECKDGRQVHIIVHNSCICAVILAFHMFPGATPPFSNNIIANYFISLLMLLLLLPAGATTTTTTTTITTFATSTSILTTTAIPLPTK